jgi:hypothetical protein
MNNQQLYTHEDFANLSTNEKHAALHYVSPTLAEVGKSADDNELIELYKTAANTDSVPVVPVIMAADGKHLALGEALHPLPELPVDLKMTEAEQDLMHRVGLDMYVLSAEAGTGALSATTSEVMLEVSRRQKLDLPTPTKAEIEVRWKAYCTKRNTELEVG